MNVLILALAFCTFCTEILHNFLHYYLRILKSLQRIQCRLFPKWMTLMSWFLVSYCVTSVVWLWDLFFVMNQTLTALPVPKWMTLNVWFLWMMLLSESNTCSLQSSVLCQSDCLTIKPKSHRNIYIFLNAEIVLHITVVFVYTNMHNCKLLNLFASSPKLLNRISE